MNHIPVTLEMVFPHNSHGIDGRFQKLTCTFCPKRQQVDTNVFQLSYMNKVKRKKSEVILVTGRGGLEGCGTMRIPYFLDNRLTDGGEVVSLNVPTALYPQEGLWYSFLLETESTPGAAGLG
jgi:hypothetical protein